MPSLLAVPPAAAGPLPVETSPVPALGDRRLALFAALAAVYVIWGSTYLVMRIAVETLPPLLMGAVRFSIAGAILLVIAAARAVGGNGLVAIAETEVSSGAAALVCATMPLWMAVFAAIAGERPTAREWLGVAVGIAGVAVLVSGAELSAAPAAAAVLAGAPVAWALGSLLARRLPLATGLMAAASQQLAGGVALAAVGLVRGERLPTTWTFDAMWSVAYLIVLGSLVAFTAYSWLLRNARPAVATSYSFVNPPLAVLLGALLGAEQVGAATLIATPLVIAAVALVVSGKR